MPKNIVNIRLVENIKEAEEIQDRVNKLIDDNDPIREFIAERPLSKIQNAIAFGHFFLIEDQSDSLVGCFALYPFDEESITKPGYELGTVMIDKNYRRFRHTNEGIISYSIAASIAEILLANRIDLDIIAYVRANNKNPDRILGVCGFESVSSDKPPKKKFFIKQNCLSDLGKLLANVDFKVENIFTDDNGKILCVKFNHPKITNEIVDDMNNF